MLAFYLLIALLDAMVVDIGHTVQSSENQYRMRDARDVTRSAIISVGTKSRVRCAALCSKHPNCAGVFLTKTTGDATVTCHLSVFDGPSESVADKSSLENPSYYEKTIKNPCDANPCLHSEECNPSDPVRSSEDYFCNCSGRRTGRNCELCVNNFAGTDCDVDITDSVLIDGTYFYVHGVVRDGKDMDDDTRPNCTESRKACGTRGMTLVTVKNSEKLMTLRKLGLDVDFPDCYSCFYQLGLSRATINGTWKWDDSENLAGFGPWYPGQPDDSLNAFYAVFSPNNNYTWLDVTCDFPAYYICEYVSP